jgi:phytoene synthase
MTALVDAAATPATALVPREAAAVARATIGHHSKSFALAARVLPPWCRDQAAVIYTYCRRADDAVDEAPGDPRAALAALRAELDEIYAGDRAPADPVLAAFQRITALRALPRHYPAELLAGMEMDVVGTRYRTIEDVVTYGYRVASVVGLMMCHVMGVADDAALVPAAHLGLAMQLTNISRDVAEDWRRGRLYLPDELLARHGGAALPDRLAAALAAGAPLPDDDAAQAALAQSTADLLALADRYYASGRRGLPALPWRCAFAIDSARRIYRAIGPRIAHAGHDPRAGRAHTSAATKLGHVALAGGRAALGLPSRLARRLAGRPRPRIPGTVLELPHVDRL